MPTRHLSSLLLLVLCLWAMPLVAGARSSDVASTAPRLDSLHVPKLSFAPQIEDFKGMEPSPRAAAAMLRVEGFVQHDPHDGQPLSQKTVVYIGYTDKNLYVVCLCFDNEPSKIRATMARRELIDSDDQFGFILDTFQDKKNGVFFYMNPFGVQQDGIWAEGNSPDYSYDMVWNSKAELTANGYLLWFEVPFKDLRFPKTGEQHWGVLFERDIRRTNEFSFYPPITANVQGFLSQEGKMQGLHEISPGRNMQFNPYVSYRAFRALDTRDSLDPRFDSRFAEGRTGLDSKVVLKDALVLDTTVNPDFAQVESDEPQITVNQRFEVFFPEKRPFFLENSSYFQTPINLVFTRRIADPEYGVRLTGKLGRWSLGFLMADDKSPGKSVIASDPLFGKKAYFGILRINRDFGKENTIGVIYTDRELGSPAGTQCAADSTIGSVSGTDPCLVRSNRVGGIDTRLKFGTKWQLKAQALASSTDFNNGTHLGGPAYQVYVERSSRAMEYNVLYIDNSPGFQTHTGFFQQPDLRHFSNFWQYKFYRQGKKLLWQGPSVYTNNEWDKSNLRLQYYANVNYRWVFERQTTFGVYGNIGHERLRPKDFSTLTSNVDYAHHHEGFWVNTAYFKQVTFSAEVNWGQQTNYDTAVGPPVLARANNIIAGASIRPVRGLTIDNTYLLSRMSDLATGANAFNNHIIRSKWNYQFNREMSVRFIGQYNTTLTNPSLSSLDPQNAFNADFLFTYLVHPGTALYVGYNSDLQNYDRALCDRTGSGECVDPTASLLRTQNRFLNDGRQIFVKIAYLFRF